ncbi:hypothetical protein, unlikely [Trypanosoma brucei gambiense DAL972]|uniref:Uncharacterized protein n=1 Tax=Trypanosoma brucei gambiense (strain MHOM/CI/86/DAL972) TaxID=679716 RepID=C9ZUE3_TRYB9|nr:hypothetical protein, unlikely [Trypanosoma brucei gambiense DAL972]CBH13030.1 hypothetical protein, unlikely [Trypanosoma brucei gambiense DAL972]|eukprot:XP_011775308.1 hypothetical protein, unlikely [Trypanosoma brucei gambiense DAL972]
MDSTEASPGVRQVSGCVHPVCVSGVRLLPLKHYASCTHHRPPGSDRLQPRKVFHSFLTGLLRLPCQQPVADVPAFSPLYITTGGRPLPVAGPFRCFGLLCTAEARAKNYFPRAVYLCRRFPHLLLSPVLLRGITRGHRLGAIAGSCLHAAPSPNRRRNCTVNVRTHLTYSLYSI